MYFSRKSLDTGNVPFVVPLPILGNYGRYFLLQDNVGLVVRKLCHQFPDKPYFGAFYGMDPVLVVQSPDLLKQILTKDFYFCNGREVSKHGTKEFFTKSLFFASGDRWKFLRQNITPLFSSAKMKNMFYLIEKCSHIFEDVLENESSISNVIEMRDLCVRYTMDCIISCAFGIETNTLAAPENNPFRLIGTEIFRATNYRGFKIIFRSICPAVFYGLGLKCVPDSVNKFFSQLLKGVFESRNYKPSSKNDFVDVSLSLYEQELVISDSIKNVLSGHSELVNFKIDSETLVSQCISLFAAGFDTSANTMGFIMFELAKNQEAQMRAAMEVDEFLRRHGNKLNYECMNDLPYITACLYETLRKYTVVGNLTREVMDDITLLDGLRLEKGIRIHIPVYNLHHNPEYFPEPESFKPERFLSENKNNIIQYAFLPYGQGPRVCIGQRFSIMQILPGLMTLLKSYRVELAEGMPEKITLDRRTFTLQPRDQGLMLKLTKREGWEQKAFVKSH